MTVPIADALVQTRIFIAAFLGLMIIFSQKRRSYGLSTTTTTELKGLAILAVIFGHIGYYLVDDHQFLFPLSICAGVGVNLFLFLSGYGLTCSQMDHPLSPSQFYRKRLLRLYLPLWMVLTLVLIVDAIRGITYPLSEMMAGYLGFFPTANLYQSIDAPLWYFTMIVFYYLIFPLVFRSSVPLRSALLVAAVSLPFAFLPVVDPSVHGSYLMHLVAFPLGMACAAWAKQHKTTLTDFSRPTRLLMVVSAMALFTFFAFHSGVGKGYVIEQTISLISMTYLIVIFTLKPLENHLLAFYGQYSYEIYLIHWPLVYTFNGFYHLFPAALATLIYLLLLPFVGLCLQRLPRYTHCSSRNKKHPILLVNTAGNNHQIKHPK